MAEKRDILRLFPTKERLVTFVRAYYSLFSRRLNVTAENFDTDDIDIHRGPYWKFWLNTAKFVGLQDFNYEAFFFLMNCISENIILLDQKKLTVENIVVPNIKSIVQIYVLMKIVMSMVNMLLNMRDILQKLN